MPTVPIIPTFGPSITPATALTQLADAVAFAMSPPKVKAIQTVAQSLANGILTLVTLDSAEFDTHTMWDAGTPSRVTAQYPGYYFITGGVATVVNDTSYRYARIAVNGTTITDGNTAVDPVPSISTRVPVRSTIIRLGIGDYVELYAQQATGGGLNTGTAAGDASSLVVAFYGQ